MVYCLYIVCNIPNDILFVKISIHFCLRKNDVSGIKEQKF